MRNNLRYFIGGVTVVVILIAVVGFMNYNSEKSGYIKLSKVYEEFELTKEYDKQMKDIQFKRKYLLDSLQMDIARSDSSGDKPTILLQRKQAFYGLSQQFEEDNDRLVKSMNEQIWKQINQYLQEYGKERSYTYIYGADGSGQLMYAADAKDITSDVTLYINTKYKGK